MYSIRNVNDSGLAWSNTHGWVDDESYDLFTESEKEEMNLPMEGRWSYVGPEPSSNIFYP